MGLCLIILSPLTCDPEPPIGHLFSVRPRVKWKCNLLVPGAWSRDALIIHTIYVALREGVPSWLAWLEQSNQRWLKTCRAGWSDLNNQTSVDWRRAELAGPTWTIKPALTEDVSSWLSRLQSKWNDLSMPVHSPPSVKPVKAQTFVLRLIEPYQSTVHQASNMLRRGRLFFVRSNHTSPQSAKSHAQAYY